MELSKKAAYLQGLVDGLGVDESTKEGRSADSVMPVGFWNVGMV